VPIYIRPISAPRKSAGTRSERNAGASPPHWGTLPLANDGCDGSVSGPAIKSGTLEPAGARVTG